MIRIKNLWRKYRCFLLAGAVSTGLMACSDDNNASPEDGNTPGILVAKNGGTLESHTMKGAVLLPVKAENPGVELETGKFTYENFSLTGEQSLENAATGMKEGTVPVVTSIEKEEGNELVLVLGYDYTEYASCQVSFTLGYEGTATAIPVTINITDGVRDIVIPHLGTGLKGQLRWTVNPEQENCVCVPQNVKGTGIHANNLSFEKDKDDYIVMLDNLFEFTSEETAQGHASIPVQVTWKHENSSEFLTYTTFNVCPSRFLEPVTIDSEEASHIWYITEEAEALGLDKNQDGNIWFAQRDTDFYISANDGCLISVKEYGTKIFPYVGNRVEGDDNRLFFELQGVNNLSAGEYVLLIHVKKLVNNPDDRQYVDFRIPFIKLSV